jgi:hypothetical protein
MELSRAENASCRNNAASKPATAPTIPNALPPSVRFHLCLCCIVAAAAFRAAQSWGKLYRYLFATVNDSSHIFV